MSANWRAVVLVVCLGLLVTVLIVAAVIGAGRQRVLVHLQARVDAAQTALAMRLAAAQSALDGLVAVSATHGLPAAAALQRLQQGGAGAANAQDALGVIEWVEAPALDVGEEAGRYRVRQAVPAWAMQPSDPRLDVVATVPPAGSGRSATQRQRWLARSLLGADKQACLLLLAALPPEAHGSGSERVAGAAFVKIEALNQAIQAAAGEGVRARLLVDRAGTPIELSAVGLDAKLHGLQRLFEATGTGHVLAGGHRLTLQIEPGPALIAGLRGPQDALVAAGIGAVATVGLAGLLVRRRRSGGMAAADEPLYETGQDRTAQMQTQLAAAVSETQALWRAIQTGAIVSVTDLQGNLIEANDAFVAISGYAREELLGQNHRIVSSGQHGPETWHEMWGAISSGVPWRGQLCNRRRDGELYWVDSLIAPILGPDGLPQRYVSIRFDITQARRLALELDRQRETLSNVVEAANVGTWEVEMDTGRTRINARWAEMLGRSSEAFVVSSMQDFARLLHPNDVIAFHEAVRQHLRGLTPYYEAEFRLAHADGRWIWIHARGKVVARHADGRARLFAGTHLDVTDRRQAEEAMRGERLLLARIERLAAVGGWQMETAAAAVRWSEEAARLFQFDMDATPSVDAVLARIRSPGREALHAAIDAACEQATGWDFEIQIDRPDGSVLWLRTVGEAEFDDAGAVRVVGAFADITPRRALEAETRRQNLLLQSVLQTIPGGVSAFDEDLRLVVANDQFRTLLDLPERLVSVGETRVEDIVRFNALRGEHGPLEDVEAFVAGIVAKAQSPLAGRLHRVRPNGVVLDIRSTPMPGGGFVTMYMDISELKRAQLVAESAARAKGQFLASMSHEIRTPMNAVLGMLLLLERTQLDAHQRDYATKAARAARALLDLLNDILDFSKAEAGRIELDPRAFEPDRLLQDLGVVLAANLGGKPLELLIDLDAQIPRVLIGDSMRLQQVLINLAGNAVKFTERGEVRVTLRCVELDKSQQRALVEFEVSDTGIGIAPEDQQRIFSGFVQAEASTARRYGGTGLGLAISQRLVEVMGGQIVLHSEPGQGSRFSFRLSLPTDPSAGQPSLAAWHVLIVDDHAQLRLTLAKGLDGLGATVELAADGPAALAALQSCRVDASRRLAVIVDAQMPGLDGWQTAAAIQAMFTQGPAEPPPLVVVLIAPGLALAGSQQGDACGVRTLAKPVTPGMVADLLLADPAEAHMPELGGRLQGIELLLAEDHPDNQQIARELLEAEGARVVVVDDGNAALAALAAPGARYDAVLMDVHMPGLDGQEATRRLRRMPQHEALPVLAMTANVSTEDRAACLAAGMNEHVGKPFVMDDLLAALARQIPRLGARMTLLAAAGLPQRQSSSVDDALEAAGQAHGLELRDALERMMGRPELLLRMSRSFALGAATLSDRLRQFQAAGDIESALLAVHGCKGLAATVGAARVARLAEEGESMLKSGCWPDAHWLAAMHETALDDGQALVNYAQVLAER